VQKRAHFVTSQRLEEIKEKKRQIERVHREFKVFFEAGESDEELDDINEDGIEQPEEAKTEKAD